MDSDQGCLSNSPASGWVTQRIVEAVSSARGVEPTRLDPPLYDAMNPDALEEFLDSADGSAEVNFQYQDLRVNVRADGQVSVSEVGPEA